MKRSTQLLFLRTGYSIWANPYRVQGTSIGILKLRLGCSYYSSKKLQLKDRLHNVY